MNSSFWRYSLFTRWENSKNIQFENICRQQSVTQKLKFWKDRKLWKKEIMVVTNKFTYSSFVFLSIFMLQEKFQGSIELPRCAYIYVSIRLSVQSHFSNTPGPKFMKLHIWTPWNNTQIALSQFLSLRLCNGKKILNAKLQFLLISCSVFVKIK